MCLRSSSFQTAVPSLTRMPRWICACPCAQHTSPFQPVLTCHVRHIMQFEEDQGLPAEERKWLDFNVDHDGKEVFALLSTSHMLDTAIERGIDEPVYMDATHGLQAYGLKLVTVHAKDDDGKGMAISFCMR